MAGRSPEPPATATAADRLRPWLAGAASALLVAQPLVTGEAAASDGDGLTGVMLWIVLGTCWALAHVGRRPFTLRFGWTDAAVLLLVGWHSFAAIMAAKSGTARPAVNMLWIWVGFALSFLLARQLVSSRREIRAMLVVMVSVAVALSGYSVYQRLYELPKSWEAYGRDPVGAMRAAGISAEPGSREAELFRDRLFSFEPLGTFSLTNSLAGYLAPWLVVAAGIGLSGGPLRENGRGRIRSAAIAGVAAVAIALCLAWTKSRSAYLAVLFGLPAMAWVCRRPNARGAWKRWKLLAAGVVAAGVLAGAVIAARSLDKRILTQASLSLGYRMQYWESSLAMIRDHPILGCGPGQFQSAYTAYKLPEASEEIADPHNFLLEVCSTAGTPAALAMLAVLGCFGWTVFARRGVVPEETQEPPGGPDAVPHLLGGGAVGFLLAVPLSMAGSVPTNPMVLLLGLPLAAATAAGLFSWIDRGRLAPLLPLVGVAVLLVNLLAAGGIGFAGVGGTLWLLLALGLNTVGDGGPRPAGQKTAVGLLAAAIFLAVGCHTTAYNPVLGCRWRVDGALDNPMLAEHRLLAAAEADPLAAEPWNLLAGVAFLQWKATSSPEVFAAFEHYQTEFIRRMPNSASARAVAAERYLRAFQRSGQREPLDQGVKLYRQAVDLYPNNATYRANLALALRVAGDQAGFQREAARAFELDALTPHADKKLDKGLADKLRSAFERSTPQAD